MISGRQKQAGILLLSACSAVSLPAEEKRPAAAERTPNIVFILADNVGYGELGVYGGGILRGASTPRIDRFASEGMRLLNFNRVPAGSVSNEIVHIVDLYTTLARVGGAEVPKDRPIDGVDQLDFFLGKQANSNREGFPAYVADRLSAVKWRNWKMHLIKQEHEYEAPQKLPLPRIINLLTDLKEERDVLMYSGWVTYPMMRILREFEASLETYPPIKAGTPDPYVAPASAGRRD